MSEPEVWLRGALPDVAPLLQPPVHSLLQSREEISALLAPMTVEQIWRSANGAASVGFHVCHAIGSLDRLLTYARGEMLSPAQLANLALESHFAPLDATALRGALDAAIARAIDQIRQTDVATLSEPRYVGRGRLPSTVIGLLFHAAEHTQRHAGQAMSTARFLA